MVHFRDPWTDNGVGEWLGCPTAEWLLRPKSLGLPCVIRDRCSLSSSLLTSKVLEPKWAPPQSWGSQCEEGALWRDMKEIGVHWRQEISLCKGTEVWEGRVWCLREHCKEGPKDRSGQLRSLHPKDLGGEWLWDPHYG